MRCFLAVALLLVTLPSLSPAQDLRLPNKPGSLKFAVIGDSGQPGGGQTAIAGQMTKWRTRFPFELVLMTGDNLYGSEKPHDYDNKFAVPYDVVISGHEHFYERLKPQKGVAYFIFGSSSKLRNGDLRKSAMTAYGNDSSYAFMLVEIDGDAMHFQTISDKGATLDAGTVRRGGK